MLNKKYFCQFFFLVILLVLPFQTQGQTTSYPDNIVIVLDTSGSMSESMEGGDKIDVARNALKMVLQGVSSETNIGLLTFDGWKYRLQSVGNKRDLFYTMDQIKPAGSTPLGKFIKHGADSLLNQRQKQLNYGNFTLLVVTDGEASDQRLVEKYAPEVMSRGINLDVIGLNMKKSHSLKNTSTSYRDGRDPRSLQTSLKEVFAEVSLNEEDSQEYYDLIAPIPNGVALKIINALTENINYPIGEVPKHPKRTNSSGYTTSSTSNPNSNSEIVFKVIVGVIFIGCIGLAILAASSNNDYF